MTIGEEVTLENKDITDRLTMEPPMIVGFKKDDNQYVGSVVSISTSGKYKVKMINLQENYNG